MTTSSVDTSSTGKIPIGEYQQANSGNDNEVKLQEEESRGSSNDELSAKRYVRVTRKRTKSRKSVHIVVDWAKEEKKEKLYKLNAKLNK